MENLKLKKSHSDEVDSKIKEIHSILSKDNADINSIISTLMSLEKKTRMDNDIDSSKKLTKTILKIFIDKKDWENVAFYAEKICKKHAQLKQVVVSVVRTAMDSLQINLNDNSKLKLLKILRNISRGKIHVELEFARMTRKYSLLLEESGDIEKASNVLHEVNAETLSSMDFEEKYDIILEQFRLSILEEDYERSELSSEKINIKWLDKQKTEKSIELKKRYLNLLIEYNIKGKRNYHEASLNYQKLIKICEDKKEKLIHLRKAILFSFISDPGTEKQKNVETIFNENKHWLEETKMKFYQDTIKKIKNKALIKVSLVLIPENREEVMKYIPFVVKEWYEEELIKNLLKHNIKSMEKHFKNVNFDSISAIIKISPHLVEELIEEMIENNELIATIDRPKKIVYFGKKTSKYEILDCWTKSINIVMEKITIVSNLIERERCLATKK